MGDYIERDLLLAFLKQLSVTSLDIKDLIGLIEGMASSNVIPVVRCGECKYQRFTDDNVPYCTRVDDDGLDMPFDDCFCSYGEKREETA